MMNGQKEVAYSYKVVLLGGGGAGKTCLFNRYCFNSFSMNTELTIGLNFHSTYLSVKIRRNSREYKQKYISNAIFDFGGQERFRSLIPKFLEGASGAFLVFDSLSYSSFNQLEYWYNLLHNNTPHRIPTLLIGCKGDLLENASDMEVVTKEYIDDFINKKEIDGYFLTSAKENINILEAFKKINKLMLTDHNIEAMII
jgi:Ras-related protein Rab-1A/Rab family protein